MTDVSTATPPTQPAPAGTAEAAQEKRVFWMGVGIILAVFVVVILLFFVTIPPANKDVLNTVIGFLVGTAAGSVIGFYYGTSASSKAKDDTISTLSKG